MALALQDWLNSKFSVTSLDLLSKSYFLETVSVITNDGRNIVVRKS